MKREQTRRETGSASCSYSMPGAAKPPNRDNPEEADRMTPKEDNENKQAVAARHTPGVMLLLRDIANAVR